MTEESGGTVEPGMVGCDNPGHPQNFSHRCADWDEWLGPEETAEEYAWRIALIGQAQTGRAS